MRRAFIWICWALLEASILLSCSTKPDTNRSLCADSISLPTDSSISDQSFDSGEESVSNYKVTPQIVGRSPFSLLRQAFSKTKSQLLVTFELMLIMLLLLSFVLFLAEHFAQPTVYKHYPTSLLWTFVKCIQDPGEMAPPKPITFLGRTVANIIGLLGVALFAIPAGIISSGFFGAMEDEKKDIEIHENINKLYLAFERKKDRPTGFQIVPRYITITDVQARIGLTEDEILTAVSHDDHFRLINLAITQNPNEHPQDILAIEHHSMNTIYGQCINRGSKVTIFSPSNIVDPIVGWWSYYLAKIGGFNYITREVGQTRPYMSYYTYRPENNIPGNKEFMTDINRLVDSDECWVFSILAASGSQEPTYPSQFHFSYGGKKGDQTYDDPNITLNEIDSFESFYNSLSTTLAQSYDLFTDKQLYHDNSNPANFARHLNFKPNAIVMRVAYSVTCWDMNALLIARDVASTINKELLGLNDNPIVPDLSIKDIGYAGYTN